MMLGLFFLLSLVLFLFLKYVLLRAYELPPGPNFWQVLRNLSQYGKEPHVAFRNLAKVYGPLISLRLGARVVVVVSSPSAAEQILKIHDRVFSGRYLPLLYYKVPQVMQSSLTSATECNGTWKFLRGLSQNCIFSSRAVDSKDEIRKAKVLEMMEFLLGKEGEVVALDDVVHATVCNIVTNVLASANLFDIRGEGEKGRKVKALVNEVVETVAAPSLTDLFPILERVDFWSTKSAMDLYHKVIWVWKDMVEERKLRRENSTISTQDFLDVLLDNAFLDDQISLLFTEILIAGTDSTFITIVWLIVELVRNQAILRRFHEEIELAIVENSINESLLSSSEYIQACIKETLRLHIPGPFLLPHRTIKKCKVNNYTIPKDSMVLVNAWAIHMDHNNWKDPTIFNPERFLDSKIDFRGTHFEYIPFSAGQRMCPGFTMAFRNIQLVVASLIHYFDWSLPNGLDPINLDTKDKFGTTLRREKSLHLIPRIRDKCGVDFHEVIRMSLSTNPSV